MNGTVTLAFVEEDNKQRVIFRVFPLCTREGEMLLGNKELFPDDGSLRIVPDKREQSTFKERMREINGLCAINLVSDGRELVKVRQNRNYAPDQGERNQQAIYSDVICEFAPGACFEVVEAGKDASGALTPMVLIQHGKLLVGPVAGEEAAATALDTLKPFGDDSFQLHQFEMDMLGTRRICWNPESLLNWRQRRSALRRKERGHVDEAKPTENAETEKPLQAAQEAPAVEAEAKEATTVEESAEKLPKPEKKEAKTEQTAVQQTQEQPKAKQEQPKAKQERKNRKERKNQEMAAQPAEEQPKLEASLPETTTTDSEETALPIGSRLEILDQELSFDQQLSRLTQPLSSSANRLSAEQETVEEDVLPEETSAHFNGTPLNRNARQITRSMRKPQSVHHVVERHLAQSGVFQDEQSTYQMVDNPIERLLMDMEYVWQNSELREGALAQLLENESFMHDMLTAFRRKGFSTRTTAAAQEQLAEIEAERLDLLLQLETAKENEKKYREKALASLSHKLKGETERLKREVATLEKTRDSLKEIAQALSSEVTTHTHQYVNQHITCMAGADQKRAVLSPVVGERYTVAQMAENLRQHMNSNGFAISEDEAMTLLVLFSVSDSLCLCASTVEDGQRFATLMMECLGLQSVSTVMQPGCNVELISLLPENDLRTPTVSIQPVGTEAIHAFGHKTIFVAAAEEELPLFMPVFRAPSHSRSSFGNGDEWQTIRPASLETFRKIRSDVHPLLTEAENWFTDMKNAMVQQQIAIPEVTLEDMRRFMEAGMRRVRGGFVAAADIAVSHWIAPAILRVGSDSEKLRKIFNGLPKTLELLHLE
ncbi:MAG: hypothetical protein J6K73_04760 [Clostridia bacterium]|nr:hypothetical protein [Clostridia bacterium]